VHLLVWMIGGETESVPNVRDASSIQRGCAQEAKCNLVRKCLRWMSLKASAIRTIRHICRTALVVPERGLAACGVLEVGNKCF
jgi:hypothetical protein